MSKNYCLYMMSNYSNTVLYLGMTNNLLRRVCEHKAKLNQGFSAKYNCDKLVYFETGKYVEDVIAREKQIKNWKRAWKNELIETMNPNWDDLSESIGITSELVSQIAAMNCDASFSGSDGLDISLEAEMDGEIAGQARNDTTNKNRNDTTNKNRNDTINKSRNDTTNNVRNNTSLIRNITDACKGAGQKEPPFEFKHGREFSVTFFSDVAITESITKSITKTEAMSETQERIVSLMSASPVITAKALAGELGIAERNVKNHIKALKDAGVIVHTGVARGGHWEVR